MFRELQKAFSTGSPFSPPTDEQLQLVDRMAVEIVRRHLTVPALATLEMSRPLNYLGAQAMHFFAPVMTTLFDPRSYDQFARFLERGDAITVMADRIEHFENEASRKATGTDEAPSASLD